MLKLKTIYSESINEICFQRRGILCKVKEIKELGGDVLVVRRTIQFCRLTKRLRKRTVSESKLFDVPVVDILIILSFAAGHTIFSIGNQIKIALHAGRNIYKFISPGIF